MVTLRGTLIIVFAILLFMNPGLTAVSLTIWFAALLMVDGVFTLFGAIRSWKEEEGRFKGLNVESWNKEFTVTPLDIGGMSGIDAALDDHQH